MPATLPKPQVKKPADFGEALELKNRLATELRGFIDKFNEQDQAWQDDEESQYLQCSADYDFAKAELEGFERLRDVAARQRDVDDALRQDTGRRPESELEFSAGELRGLSAERVREIAFDAVCLAGSEYISPLHEAAAAAMNMDLDRFQGRKTGFGISLLGSSDHGRLQAEYLSRPQSRRHHSFFNAPLVTTTAGLGGNVIPPESLLTALEVNMLAFGGVLRVADTITTSTGEPMGWPTIDDTGNMGRIIAQNAPHDDNAGGGASGDGGPNPTFGKTLWGAFDYTSDTVLVPFRLMRDAVVPLAPIIGQLTGERLGRIFGKHCAVGVGTTEPSGIVTDSVLGVTAASATAIAPDEVYTLQHSVDEAYRAGGVFMCRDSTILHLRLKKDSQNRYLWHSGMQDGVPDQLAGSPVETIQEMDAIATGKKTLLYGQGRSYKVRRVGVIRFYHLMELYRNNDQDGFSAMMSGDGGLLNAGTAPVKHLIQL